MGNYDRSEKLEMLGELDEKYIKEADKYLAQPLAESAEAIVMAPVNKKLSWKPFAAFAACAAVIIGGAAFLSKYLNSRPIDPPVYNTSDSSDSLGNSGDNSSNSSSDDISAPVIPNDEYLIEMAELYGTNVNIDYVRNKLDITEVELPEDIAEAVRSMNGSPMIPYKDNIIIKRVDKNGYPEIGMYDAKSGYQTMHSRSDDQKIDKNTELNILYADNSKIYLEAVTYRGAAIDKRELRRIDIGPKVGMDIDDQGYPWVTIYTTDGGKVIDSRIAVVDFAVYFSVKENADDNSFNQQIYRYGFGLKDDNTAKPVAEGAGLCTFNDDVYYRYDESGLGNGSVLRSLSGDIPIDTAKFGGKDLTIGGSGIYDCGSTVTNCISEYVILSGGTMQKIGATAFGFGLVAGDENDRAIYNADTDELLVFDKDDELRTNLDWIGFDDGVCAYTAAPGRSAKLWFITKKDVVPARPNIRNIKNRYKIDVPMGYVEDNFDIISYDMPETLNGKYVDGFNFCVIDRERTVVMLYDNSNPELYDFAVYNFTDGSFEMIYQPSADKYGSSRLEYVDTNYLVFSVYEKSETYWSTTAAMYIIDLTSGNYTPAMIYTDNDTDESHFSSNVVLLNNKLYFNDYYGSYTIYCYDIKTAELEKVGVGHFNVGLDVYNGTIVYEVSDGTSTSLESIDGSVKISGGASGFWVCENDVFRLNDNQGSPTSVTTGKKLIVGGKQYAGSSCGKYISFRGSYNYWDQFVYDIANDRMLIYSGEIECSRWLPDGTGVAMRFQGGAGSNSHPYKLYIFTER